MQTTTVVSIKLKVDGQVDQSCKFYDAHYISFFLDRTMSYVFH